MAGVVRELACHCGEIRLSCDAPLTSVIECNCSTCGRTGILHWKVPAASLSLTSQRIGLSTYAWRGLHEGQHFCRICGTAMMRTGYPGDRVSLNARCIVGIDVFDLETIRYDGRNKMPPGPTL